MVNYSYDRVRRNHGLEHATLHILARRHPGLALAGHSDQIGFWILGNVPVEAVSAAVNEALQRLRSGQSRLAVHPNCGTNYVTSGIFAGTAAWLALMGAGKRFRERLERLPLAVTLATLALQLARPIGMLLQERLTTSAQPGGLEIQEIRATRRAGLPAYRVITRG